MISDRRRFGDHAADRLVDAVAAAARAGLDLIQIRERDLDARSLIDLVRRCVDAARGTRARILVNDRTDVAIAAGAHGVHLRADSMPACRVRAIAPAGFLIGRSVHDRDETVRASDGGGLDYVMFGTVFATRSKPDVSPAGTGMLAQVAAATPLPVIAIGGITEASTRGLQRTGAAGIAAIGLFADCDPAALPAMIVRVSNAFQDHD